MLMVFLGLDEKNCGYSLETSSSDTSPLRTIMIFSFEK